MATITLITKPKTIKMKGKKTTITIEIVKYPKDRQQVSLNVIGEKVGFLEMIGALQHAQQMIFNDPNFQSKDSGEAIDYKTVKK